MHELLGLAFYSSQDLLLECLYFYWNWNDVRKNESSHPSVTTVFFSVFSLYISVVLFYRSVTIFFFSWKGKKKGALRRSALWVSVSRSSHRRLFSIPFRLSSGGIDLLFHMKVSLAMALPRGIFLREVRSRVLIDVPGPAQSMVTLDTFSAVTLSRKDWIDVMPALSSVLCPPPIVHTMKAFYSHRESIVYLTCQHWNKSIQDSPPPLGIPIWCCLQRSNLESIVCHDVFVFSF